MTILSPRHALPRTNACGGLKNGVDVVEGKYSAWQSLGESNPSFQVENLTS